MTATTESVVPRPTVIPHQYEHERTLGKNVGDMERLVSGTTGLLMLGAGAARGGVAGLALGSIAAGLLVRAFTGHSRLYERLGISSANGAVHPERIRLERAITIDADPAELYALWRAFENLPRFMDHLESVRILDGDRSEWTILGPNRMPIRWIGEVTEDVENERIAWRSTEHSPVDQQGEVTFLPAPGDRGTEVHLSLEYRPPAGAVGVAIGKLLSGLSAQALLEDLRHLKQLVETEHIPTTTGQPHGERGQIHRLAERAGRGTGWVREEVTR